VDMIVNAAVYRVRQKVGLTLKIFGSFISNCLEFQSKILPTYLVIVYTHKSLISIAFSVFKHYSDAT